MRVKIFFPRGCGHFDNGGFVIKENVGFSYKSLWVFVVRAMVGIMYDSKYVKPLV